MPTIFWFHKDLFSEQFLKNEEQLNNLNNCFFHYKEPFVELKVSWMLEVVHGTIDGNKEECVTQSHCFV